MGIIFLAILGLHGLIHLMGFLKGFNLLKTNDLILPVSKKQGVLWLIASLLFFTTGAMYLCNIDYWWIMAICSVGISQILIIIFWQDAKFGTIANIIILFLTFTAYQSDNFKECFIKDMIERKEK